MSSRKLKKLEDTVKQKGIKVHYAKGNFNSGYCRLKEEGVIIINKYFDLPGRILSLEEIIKELEEEE